MDLGKSKLRRAGINTLKSAYHSRHGLVWHTERDVFLSSVVMRQSELENTSSVLIGSFESVHGVSWCNSAADSLLAITHSNSVTVWKIGDGRTCKQLKSINVTVISQGCLWNPVGNCLCLLAVHGCSVHLDHQMAGSDSSVSLTMKNSDRVHCGCWSYTGQKLAVATGCNITVYSWANIYASASDYVVTAATSPNLMGSLSALEHVEHSLFVATVELPLERLFQASHNVDLFKVPEFINCDSGTAAKEPATNVKAHSRSVQQLFNLERNVRRESSQLVLFEIQDDGSTRTRSTVNLDGLLSPDLLLVDANKDCGQFIIVGSNASRTLLVFSKTDLQLIRHQELLLAPDERPKGLCSGPQPNSDNVSCIMVAVGKPAECPSLFVPSSTMCSYELKVQLISILPVGSGVTDRIKAANLQPSPSATNHVPMASVSKSDVESVKENRTDVRPTEILEDELLEDSVKAPSLLPSITTLNRRIIEVSNDLNSDSTYDCSDLETEACDFQTTPAKFKNDLLLRFGDSESERLSLLVDANMSSKQCRTSADRSGSSCRTRTSAANSDSRGTRSVEPLASTNRARTTAAYVSNDLTTSMATVEKEQPLVAASNSDGDLPRQTCFKCLCESKKAGVSDLGDDVGLQVKLLQRQLTAQSDKISVLESKIDFLSRQLLTDDRTVIHQSSSTPDLVHVILQSGRTPGPESNCLQKTFVLENGKLTLDAVKQAFGLTSVEIIINGRSCVVGCDRFGYIPLVFAPNQTIHLSTPT